MTGGGDSSGDASDSRDAGFPGEVAADEAFAVLGNDTRLEILRTLWDARDETLSFTELRESVGISQGTQFNYHLDKLTDHFVRKADDGYTLSYAGKQVMRSVLSGALTRNPSLAPIEIDAQCPYCDGAVELSYRNERLTAQCTRCDGLVGREYPQGTILSYGFPPTGLLDRSPDELFQAAHVLYDAKITPMMNGVCPECGGDVNHVFDVCDDHDLSADDLCPACDTRIEVWVEYVCGRCQYSRSAPAWFELLREPPVIAFYHEHSDFDQAIPFSKFTSENAPYVQAISESVLSRDPIRLRVVISLDDAELLAVLDEELAIRKLETNL